MVEFEDVDFAVKLKELRRVEYSDPSLLEELEWAPPEAIVPRDILRTVMKDTKRRRDLTAKVTPNARAWSTPAATPQKGRGRGAGQA